MQITALTVAGLIFLLVSIMHLVRLILRVQIKVGGFIVPLWFSIFGFVIPLLLSIWMFRSAR